MEKREAILLKDEEGTHYIPIANIASVCEEIGVYDYRKGYYKEKYPKARYVIRANNEWFYVTKQVYEKIIECCYNVVVEGERSNGDI